MSTAPACVRCGQPMTPDGVIFTCASCSKDAAETTSPQTAPPDIGAKNYWLFILGFIVFGVVTSGSIYPPGVVGVLIAAGLIHLYVRHKNR